MRRTLYKTARIMGDAKAIATGRFPQRLVRRFLYKRAGRAAGWLSKLIGVGR